MTSKEDADGTIAERLDRLRIALGYESLRQFWMRLVEESDYDLSYQSVRNYHSGREPPPSYLRRVSEVTDVSLDWLIKGEGSMWGSKPAGGEESDARPPEAESVEADSLLLRAVWAGASQLLGATQQVDVLVNLFSKQIPHWDALDVTGRVALLQLCQRKIEVEGGSFTPADAVAFGEDVGELVWFPEKRLGLDPGASPRRFSQYVVALAQALRVAIPDPGEIERTEGYGPPDPEGHDSQVPEEER